MRYFLSHKCFLKLLEFPAVYDTGRDELFELDEGGFEFLKRCTGREGCESGQCDREFLEYVLHEGILTTERGAIERLPLRKAPEPSLRYLELQVTRRSTSAVDTAISAMQTMLIWDWKGRHVS